MAIARSEAPGLGLPTPLFDRFERPGRSHVRDLTRDLADILGSRRAVPGQVPGVLAWGLEGIGTYSPSSEDDRRRLANQIARLIERFEPRLENVVVTPVESSTEFRFTLEASLVHQGGGGVRLRILTPRRGGTLGAEVSVVGTRGAAS